MAAAKQEPVVLSLKLWVDDEINRVVAAEADKDFVDILFSFLTLPIGTIIRLTSTSAKEKPSAAVKIGCVNKIYEGVQNLSREYWQTEHCKNMVLNPRNPLWAFCKNLKINIDDSGSEFTYRCKYTWECKYHSIYQNISCKCGSSTSTYPYPKASSNEGAFLKGGIEFLITDDLQVRPASPEILAQLIPDTGSNNASRLREMCVNVSKAEVPHF
ncbi:unnamed protein product [Cuscuta epithymum]|uniref:Uncharacterized protein n=1 Tax=Cuscuta epithymum TaxID=186058 RepID=A0AAV0GIJ2_9ASTE|nr:unnamed protein product [Cuscuta epithymum]